MQTKVDLKSFCRRVVIKERFNNVDNQDESLVRNKSNRAFTSNNDHLNNIIKKIESIDTSVVNVSHNISHDERNPLNELKQNDNIIFKKADKGGAIVLMDKPYYRDHLVHNCHLNSPTYSKVDINSDVNVVKQVKTLVKSHESCLTKNEFKIPIFYLLELSNVKERTVKYVTCIFRKRKVFLQHQTKLGPSRIT